jgi:hypothetical protein
MAIITRSVDFSGLSPSSIHPSFRLWQIVAYPHVPSLALAPWHAVEFKESKAAEVAASNRQSQYDK